MKRRCSPRETDAAHRRRYADRGITVCSDWQRFEGFRDWALTNGYADDLTIERLNIDVGYEPSNCTWIPRPEQNRNTSKTVRITYNGETMILEDAARRYGIQQSTLWMRIYHYGWSVYKALTVPVKERHARIPRDSKR
jgi:hypothetical protein